MHGSPWPPYGDYLYPGSPVLKRAAELDVDYLLLGHTHVAMAKRIGHTLVINPGSLGGVARSRGPTGCCRTRCSTPTAKRSRSGASAIPATRPA